MTRPIRFSISALVVLAWLAACNPTFNWRDVRPAGTQLTLLMPCKPDTAQKIVPMAGQPTALSLLSCDTGGVTFALAVADVKNPAAVPRALAQWQIATLANMKAAPATPAAAFKLPGLAGAGVLIKATGQRANGQSVSSQAAYFVQGSQVFQAVIYADNVLPEVAQTFFSGLKFE